MTVNLDVPILNRRIQIDFPKFGLIDNISRAVDRSADDASSRLGNVRLPHVDLGGAVDGAKKTIDQAVRNLGDSGDAVAHSAERAAATASMRAGQLTDSLDSTMSDLRSLRITRDRGRDPWPGVALILGVVGGVVAMFLFDPRDGKRRRTVLVDKLGKWGRVATREAKGKAVDLHNRSHGLIHEARSALGGDEGSSEQPASGAYSETRQPVGVAIGGTTDPATSNYSDWGSEPAPANGRETIS